MKNFTLFMVLIFLGLSNATAVAQGSWNLQTNPVSATASPGKLKFVSANEGWVSISNGFLLHTLNGGTTWTEMTNPYTSDVIGSMTDPGLNISFINPSIGWVLKTFGTFDSPQGAVVYKTANGGTSWNRIVLSTATGDLGLQIQFIDANKGWVLIYNMNTGLATFKKTTDGGTNWTATNGAGIFYYVTPTIGYSYSAGPSMLPPYTFYKTINGGSSWTPQYVDNTTGELNAIQFTDINNGWIVGRNGKIFRTTNGGTIWTAVTNTGLTSGYDSKALYFINATTGWIGAQLDNSSDNAIILKTTNGGASWTTQSTPAKNPISISFWDENNGWFTSDDNKIAKYSGSTGNYTNATLNGPWFMYTNVTPIEPRNDNLNYFVFDGKGNITDFNGFGGPWTGNYNVSPSGVISGTLMGDGQSFPIGGQLISTTEGTATGDGQNWRLHKVVNPGALQDKIEGRLSTQYQGLRDVTLYIDNQGKIVSAYGLAAPVSGKVYADLGVFIGHITTGENSNEWKELTIRGYFSSDDLSGEVALDSDSEGMTIAKLRRLNNPITDWKLQTNPLEASTTMCGAMQFVSETEGWISIAPGGLLHTTDGGITWIEKKLHPTDVISSPSDPGVNLSFINQTGWVLKTFGTWENPLGAVVYKTTDGGTNWERNVISTTAGDFGFELQFVDANTGWLMLFNFNTYAATFLKTTDGGTNWVPTNGAGIFSFVDANNGWAYSSPDQLPPYTIYKTTNGGTNWTPIATDNTVGEINKMKFFDLNNGWIVGGNGKILKTSDGGLNWIPITNTGITSEYKNKSVHFINPNVGWISSKRDNSNDNSIVLHTTDGGANWATQSTPSNNEIFSIYFWNANNGWFAGDYGLIASYTGTLNVKENTVNKFIAIYPNPNNGTFYFSLKDSNSKVKAEIFNLSGQKVYEESNFELKQKNEVNFAPQSKGIYLIKITDGDNSYSEKIMIK